MNDIFKLRKNTNNLRNVQSFETQNPRTKWYSLDCTAYIASQIWQTFFIEIQDTILLKIVKQNKNLVLQFLSMLLLQTLHSPGFIQMWSLHCIFSEGLIYANILKHFTLMLDQFQCATLFILSDDPCFGVNEA